MVHEYMKIWDAVSRPTPDALRPIKGGRLKGMSDINPSWRYRAMTEQFGPCGVGWKFSIDKTWTEPTTENQVFVWAQVSLYVKIDGVWSDAIPGVGGNFTVKNESMGLHANDEGYKMAVTDALGTACKMLGVASAIYENLWDGSKYRDEAPEPAKPKTAKEAWAPPTGAPKAWSKMNQQERFRNVMGKIDTIRTQEDKRKALEELKSLMTDSRLAVFTEAEKADIIDAILQAEQDIGAALSGQE